jgi:hypothetical protein
VPVRLIVGAVLNEDDADDVLAAAVATAQSSRHISINRWSDAAQDAMTARRMVNHLLHRQMVSPAFAALVADEELTAEEITSLVPGWDSDPMHGPNGRIHPLWRAVLIVHTLTRYRIFDEAKRFIRSDRGFGQVRDDRYAGFLGVLIDMPWRAAKPATTDVARRAWRNGPVPGRLRRVGTHASQRRDAAQARRRRRRQRAAHPHCALWHRLDGRRRADTRHRQQGR